MNTELTTFDEENILLWELVRPAMERIADQVAEIWPAAPRSHLDPHGAISIEPKHPVTGLPVTEETR